MKKEIVYDENMGLKLDIYESDKSSCVFVYFYGGGLERGSKEDSAAFACELSNCGISTVVPDYHMCPGQQYPDFIETAADAVRTAAKYAGKRKLFVGGHSSGAYVAMMLCFGGYLKDINISGWVFASGQTTTHNGILAQRGIDSKRIVVDDASPLYNITGKYAPILITVGEKDSFPCRVEQNVLLASVLKSVNKKAIAELHVLEGETHGSYIEGKEGKLSVFCELITQFIAKI